jgi:hypothetical protein
MAAAEEGEGSGGRRVREEERAVGRGLSHSGIRVWAG